MMRPISENPAPDPPSRKTQGISPPAGWRIGYGPSFEGVRPALELRTIRPITLRGEEAQSRAGGRSRVVSGASVVPAAAPAMSARKKFEAGGMGARVARPAQRYRRTPATMGRVALCRGPCEG
jgi:hypothetical protein